MLLPAVLLLLFFIVDPWLQLQYDLMGFSVGLVLSGFILQPCLAHARYHGWCEFMKDDPFSDENTWLLRAGEAGDSVDEDQEEEEEASHGSMGQNDSNTDSICYP